jgi:hypothetical protein
VCSFYSMFSGVNVFLKTEFLSLMLRPNKLKCFVPSLDFEASLMFVSKDIADPNGAPHNAYSPPPPSLILKPSRPEASLELVSLLLIRF